MEQEAGEEGRADGGTGEGQGAGRQAQSGSQHGLKDVSDPLP